MQTNPLHLVNDPWAVVGWFLATLIIIGGTLIGAGTIASITLTLKTNGRYRRLHLQSLNIPPSIGQRWMSKGAECGRITFIAEDKTWFRLERRTPSGSFSWPVNFDEWDQRVRNGQLYLDNQS